MREQGHGDKNVTPLLEEHYIGMTAATQALMGDVHLSCEVLLLSIYMLEGAESASKTIRCPSR